jgi:outer membrane protein
MKKIVVSLCAFCIQASLAQAGDLLSIYELALQRDPTIHAAEANRNAVLENKPQSIAKLLPTLSIAGNLNRNSVKSKFATDQLSFIAGARNVGFWSSGASVNLTQPIYHHELWVQLSQADSQIAQAEANFESERQKLILRTAQAYFNILYAQDALEFAKAEKRAIERQLEQAKARFEVGLVAITDVNEAQAGYDQSAANAIKAENELDNAREALREIVAEHEGELAGLEREIPLQSPEPSDIEAWNKRALESNLAVLAAQSQSDIARKNIELQFAGHMPSLDLSASAAFSDNNRPRGIPSESQTIGMQVNIPLYQGGLVSSRVRQAREQYESALESLDVQRRAAMRQVKNAYRGVISSISQAAALKSATVSAQSALEASEAGLEVGTRTMVEVLTQQKLLFGAKRDYAKARYDYIVNSLSLKQAAGLLQREDVELVNRWLKKKS